MSDSFPAPTPPPKREPSAWWPLSRWGNTQKAISAVVGFLILAAIALSSMSGSSEDDKGKPSKGQELCEVLRDPGNRLLIRRDFERLADMTTDELQRYVAVRCPDQSFRVD